MFYEIQYDICSIFIYVFSLYYVLAFKGLKRLQNRFFTILVLDGMFAAIFDILSASAIHNPALMPHIATEIVTYGYLILHIMQPVCIILFAVYSLSMWRDRASRMRYMWFLVTPFLVELIVILLNPFLHWVFYFDEAGIYHRAYMFILIYLIAIIYCAWMIVLLFKHRKTIKPFLLLCLLFYVAASFIATIVQLVRPQLLIELFIQSLTCIGIMTAISAQEDTMDRVTGLYSMDVFIEDNGIAIGTHPYSLIIVRLTNIPYYNGTVGVKLVDGALKYIADYLAASHKGRTYYYGNGIFAMMLQDMTDEEIRGQIAALRNYFQEAVVYRDVSFAFHTQILRINVPEDASTIDRILLLTQAQYRTDNRRCAVYDGDELKLVERDVEIERSLQRALRERTLTVYFQPIWWREENKIHSAEALMRLFDDELGAVHTEEFIAVAEKTGLIYDVGIYVLEEVCRLYRERDFKSLGIEYVEVNLSAVQCMRRGLTRAFKEILEKYHLDGRHINLEITESAAADNAELLAENLSRMRDLGITFSLDDYGTGYSNFTYLLEMEFANIKLDRSILWSADDHEEAKSILKYSIGMIRDIGGKALVEGVETKEQKDMLCEYGCDYLQGYYFSRPVPAEEYARFLELRREQDLTVPAAPAEMADEPGDEAFGKIAHALSSGFERIYYVDTDSNHYVAFSSEGRCEDLQIEHSGADFFTQTARRVESLVHPADRERVTLSLQKETLLVQLIGTQPFSLVYRLMDGDRAVYHNLKAVRAENRGSHRLIIGVSNVDDQIRQARLPAQPDGDALNLLRLARELSVNMESIYYVDGATERYHEFTQPNARETLCLGEEGERFFSRFAEKIASNICAEDRDEITALMNGETLKRMLEETGTLSRSFRLLIDGVPTYYQMKLTYADGCFLVAMSNVDTERRRDRALALAQQQINRDALTGVKSKHAFIEAEKNWNALLQQHKAEPFAVVWCDLNGLKTVNDTRGHQAGDEYIREACHVICNVFKHSPVYRVGGDEFVAVLTGADYENRASLLQGFSSANEEHVRSDGVSIACGMSELRRESDRCFGDVVERADAAMYEDKKRLKLS